MISSQYDICVIFVKFRNTQFGRVVKTSRAVYALRNFLEGGFGWQTENVLFQ